MALHVLGAVYAEYAAHALTYGEGSPHPRPYTEGPPSAVIDPSHTGNSDATWVTGSWATRVTAHKGGGGAVTCAGRTSTAQARRIAGATRTPHTHPPKHAHPRTHPPLGAPARRKHGASQGPRTQARTLHTHPPTHRWAHQHGASTALGLRIEHLCAWVRVCLYVCG